MARNRFVWTDEWRRATIYLKRKWDTAIGRPLIAGSLSFLPAVLGGLIAVWPHEIAEATQRFVTGPQGDVAWWIVAFWISVVVWASLLFVRLAADDRKEASRFTELAGAISRAPNYTVIDSYRATFDEIPGFLSLIPEQESEVEVADRIRAALVIIAALTAKFRGAANYVRYGANVMLVIRPSKSHEECFAPDILAVLRFFDRTRSSLCALDAILYLPAALLYHGAAESAPGRIPLIALPVPHVNVNKIDSALVLPGAPWALLKGGVSVYRTPELCVISVPISTGWFATKFRRILAKRVMVEPLRALQAFASEAITILSTC